jgi:HYR domain
MLTRWLLIACAAVFVVCALPTTVAADPPFIFVNNVVTEATGPNGAPVSYTVTTSDDNGSPQISCSPADGSVFPILANQLASCTATDTVTGEQATWGFTVTVQDTTPPTLNLPSPITAEATGPSGAVVTYTATADDIVDGTLPASCSPASGSTFPVGTTSVDCTATDAHSNSSSGSFSVTVQDTTPPVVTVPAPITIDAAGSGAVVTYTASASDNVSGSLTPTCTPASGSTFPVGTTTVDCNATDGAGNTGSNSFTVTVRDTTPPTLNLPGPITVEATGPNGAVVTYTATATDNVSGNVTPSCSPQSDSTFPLGTTTVTCTATDTAGNSASGTFTVTVRDTTPPTLGLPAPILAEATGPNGAAVSYTATANDTVSGSLTPTCDPASGSTFPLGLTTVSCTVRDGAGNATSGQFTVTVQDTVAPAIKVAAARVSVEAVSSGGAPVTYALPTAQDLVDGPVPVSCTPKPGAQFRFGSTTVDCHAIDSRGNASSASFEVLVVDTTPPVLTVPAAITVSSNGAQTLAASDPIVSKFLSGATARDIVAGGVSVTNNAPSTFPVGTTTVTFSAADPSGNTATATSTVTVVTQAVPRVQAPDRTPPDNVRGLSVKIGDRQLKLSWKPPLANDFDHVRITRSSTAPGAAETPVYTGSGTKFVDRRVLNGTDYRYVITSYDHAGNRSAGIAVVAAPKARMLVKPADGARVSSPPTLTWVPVAGASYYNVQLFRGNVKVLSAWPAYGLKLTKAWKYAGRTYHLTPGRYRWYVFPGFGARSAAKYGPVLGTSSFVVVKGKS